MAASKYRHSLRHRGLARSQVPRIQAFNRGQLCSLHSSEFWKTSDETSDEAATLQEL